MDELTTIREIISSSRTAFVTTRDDAGRLVSRPLAVLQDDDFDGTLWFFTQDPSPKSDDVERDDRVNVALSDGKSFLSIAGTATVEHDRGRIEQMWNPAVKSWFEMEPTDPRIALLRIDAESAEYWSSDRPAVARAFQFVKGIVTGTRPDAGENGTVEL